MKHFLPEISWHSRSSILSVDFQRGRRNQYKMATAGIEPDVRLWQLDFEAASAATGSTAAAANVESLQVNFVANLRNGHQRAINCAVRLSNRNFPGERLASADVDRNCIIWHKKNSDAPDIFADEDDPDLPPNRENWTVAKRYRCHKEDVSDLAWSPDGRLLLTTSIDCRAQILDIASGIDEPISVLTDFRQFANGACFDPLQQLLCVMSNDRTLRVYKYNCNSSSKSDTSSNKCKLVQRVSHARVAAFEGDRGRCVENSENMPRVKQVKERRLFHDDQMPSFVRRAAFTPDGELLLAPAGVDESGTCVSYCSYIFTRRQLDTPAVIIPSPKHPTIAVAVSPIYYALLDNCAENLFSLPYRFVFAVMSTETLSVYDSQRCTPLAHMDRMHYATLSDCAWSCDGRVLVCGSQDGYCSVVRFGPGELGRELSKDEIPERPKTPVVGQIGQPASGEEVQTTTPARKLPEAKLLARWLGSNSKQTPGKGADSGTPKSPATQIQLQFRNCRRKNNWKNKKSVPPAPGVTADPTLAPDAKTDAPVRKAPRRIQVVTLDT